VELSSIYHDVIKDRLYTDPANSLRRRSTQTALHRLVTGLCQMLAPILAYTADEAWEFIPGKPTGSVHESELKPSKFSLSNDEIRDWRFLLDARQIWLPYLEEARREKIIGKALDAKIQPTAERFPELVKSDEIRNTFKELLNVSQINFLTFKTNPIASVEDLGKRVVRADGQKCERCWHWETDIGQNVEHPTLCGRCVEAVKQFKT